MWAGTSLFQAGEHVVAVRFTSPTVQARVAATFLGPGATADPPPPSYGVATSTRRGGAELHELTWGPMPVLRTSEVATLIARIGEHLGAHAAWEPGAWLVDAVAVVADGQAILLPASQRGVLAALDRRLASSGVTVLASPWVEIDLDRATIVAPPPWPAGGLDDQIADRTGAGRGRGVHRTHLGLRGWLIETDDAGAPPTAAALAGVMGQVHRPADVSPAEFVHALVTMVGRVPIQSLSGLAPRDLARTVVRMFEPDRT